MKVLFLGNETNPLIQYLKQEGESVAVWNGKIDEAVLNNTMPDFIISYGYRHIIKEWVINRYPDKIINLHISMLPWNRGADPNFWSFIDDTPKGVSIHYVDKGIDTGDIIAQKEVFFQGEHTLKTSYDKLQDEIQLLFRSKWKDIKSGNIERKKQTGNGSFHKSKDKEPLLHLLPKGYDTPVAFLIESGKKLRNVKLQ